MKKPVWALAATISVTATRAVFAADDTAPRVVDSTVSPAPISPTDQGIGAAPNPTAAAPIATAAAGGGGDADVARMHGMLTGLSSGYDGYRISSAIAGLAIGGIAIPTGIVMLTRVPANSPTSASMGGAIILGAGIGAVVGGGLNLVLSINPSTKLLDGFEKRRSAGVPGATNITETELLWRQAAEEMHNARKIGGAFGIGIGAVGMGVGMYYALSPKMTTLGRPEQDGYAALFMTAGIVSVIGGLQALFIQSSLETSWEGYRGGKGLAKVQAPRPQVGVAPMPGGGLLSLSSQF